MSTHTINFKVVQYGATVLQFRITFSELTIKFYKAGKFKCVIHEKQ